MQLNINKSETGIGDKNLSVELSADFGKYPEKRMQLGSFLRKFHDYNLQPITRSKTPEKILFRNFKNS